MIQRNERLSKALRGEVVVTPNGDVAELADDEANAADKKEVAGGEDKAKDEALADEKVVSSEKIALLDEQVKEWNSQLVSENKSLHRLNTSLHEKNHFASLKQAEFEELINAETTKNEELQNKLDDLDYELTKCRMRNGKLETVLIDTQVNFGLLDQFLLCSTNSFVFRRN